MCGARRTQNTSMSGVSLNRMTAAADRGLAIRVSIFLEKPWRLPMMLGRLLFVVLAGFVALPCQAEVVRIEVKVRGDVLAGKSFGSAGPYEKLSGKIYFAIEPRNSANQIIA